MEIFWSHTNTNPSLQLHLYNIAFRITGISPMSSISTKRMTPVKPVSVNVFSDLLSPLICLRTPAVSAIFQSLPECDLYTAAIPGINPFILLPTDITGSLLLRKKDQIIICRPQLDFQGRMIHQRFAKRP